MPDGERITEPDSTVPETVVVSCPMHHMTVRVRTVCLDCPHFHGMFRANPDPRIAYTQRHQVACRYPRRLVITEFKG